MFASSTTTYLMTSPDPTSVLTGDPSEAPTLEARNRSEDLSFDFDFQDENENLFVPDLPSSDSLVRPEVSLSLAPRRSTLLAPRVIRETTFVGSVKALEEQEEYHGRFPSAGSTSSRNCRAGRAA